MNERFSYFDVDDPAKDHGVVQLWIDDEFMGAIFIRKGELLPEKKHSEPRTKCWQVSAIEVAEKYRRRGLATKLYAEAARLAARGGLALCSDVPLSLDAKAQAFWEKQVQKGRARWEVPGPAVREGENYDYGRYVLKFPPPASLSGA